MSLSQKINDYINFKIPKDTKEEESERLYSQKKKLWNLINNTISFGKWECNNYNCNCPFQSSNLDDFLKHEIKCFDLKVNYNELCKMIDENELRSRLPQNLTCKYCNTIFKTKNLLSQHKNRGKAFKCVPKTLKNLIDQLSIDEQIYYLNHIRNRNIIKN